MDWPPINLAATAVSALATLAVLWLWKLNRALKSTPPAVLAVTPTRWTEADMDATYARLQQQPIDWAPHLPPSLPRRYVVVGGSGGVGGEMVLQLLQRGQPPESIRIVDLRAPERPDMLRGSARRVDFVRADIADAASTLAAFAKPWPAHVQALPLTVFHTAAVILYAERRLATYRRCERVNVDGARHVLDAAHACGADILVATSSSSVAVRPVEYWQSTLRPWPRRFWQAIDESDFDAPLRPHADFFGNYPHTKAVAERAVCAANRPGFRTGVVRPANGIYGSSYGDVLIGRCLRSGTLPSWTPNIAQNLVHAGHVSLAHLLFEAALLPRGDGDGDDGDETLPPCAGRPFNVSDAGPIPLFSDLYRAIARLSVTPFRLVLLPPALMLVLAHVVEGLDALADAWPALLGRLRPTGDLAMLQPAVFTASTHCLASDAAAHRSVQDGGLGYRAVCTTMEGVLQQVLDWNREQGGMKDISSSGYAAVGSDGDVYA